MNGQLIPVGGGDPIPLLKKKIVIGRRPDCDICLPFPNVSGHHCELRFIEGMWLIKDLGSSNGVKVNSEKVTKKRLMPGDQVTIARHHPYRIEYNVEGAGPTVDRRESGKDDSNVFTKSLLERAGLKKSDKDDFDSDIWKDDSSDDDSSTPRWSIEGDDPPPKPKKRPR
ncbi:MAG: FHA domain-containing protein [Planctomycetota bacterium]